MGSVCCSGHRQEEAGSSEGERRSSQGENSLLSFDESLLLRSDSQMSQQMYDKHWFSLKTQFCFWLKIEESFYKVLLTYFDHYFQYVILLKCYLNTDSKGRSFSLVLAVSNFYSRHNVYESSCFNHRQVHVVVLSVRHHCGRTHSETVCFTRR